MIDSHCHLADEAFTPDLGEVVERAKGAGLTHALVVVPADEPADLQRARRVAELWPDVRFAVGIHPHTVNAFGADPHLATAEIDKAMATLKGVRAIGEMGLDYHYDTASPVFQRAVFRHQIRFARSVKLPIVIHSRDADEDMARILVEESAGEVGGVFHCFTGDRALAQKALDLGFYISFAGILTFHRAYELQQVAQSIPIDRLLIETDSPYLAPVPHRGKRNEPAWVVRVAEVIADLRDMSVEEIGRAVRANFVRLFAP